MKYRITRSFSRYDRLSRLSEGEKPFFFKGNPILCLLTDYVNVATLPWRRGCFFLGVPNACIKICFIERFKQFPLEMSSQCLTWKRLTEGWLGCRPRCPVRGDSPFRNIAYQLAAVRTRHSLRTFDLATQISRSPISQEPMHVFFKDEY